MLSRPFVSRVVAVVWLLCPALAARAGDGRRLTDRDHLRQGLTQARVGFVANQGQTDPEVAYYARTFAGTTYVTRQGEIVHSLKVRKGGDSACWTLTEKLVGGTSRPLGRELAAARASYFGGDPSQWRTEVRTYGSLALGQVWPGIHVFLRADGSTVEKLFAVSAGASARWIRLRVSGARSLGVDRQGRLVARTARGRIIWSAPVAYQEVRGQRRLLRVSYAIHGREYGFHLGPRDRSLPVVIDPLLQATYLGGSGNDYAFALAIHPKTGEVFVAGRTESPNFPGVTGGPQSGHGGGLDDVFVARLNRDLTVLEQSTYFGGSGIDFPIAIAIHPITEEVFVVGQTGSTNLPGTAGAAQARYGGNFDAFVACFSPSLTQLIRATYLGGSGGDGAEALAIDAITGDLFVAGYTGSMDFPRAAGGAQAVHGNAGRAVGYDGFVARLNSHLTVLKQATYLGGSGSDVATDIAIHPLTGEVFVVGQTDARDFPGTAGGAQAEYGEGVLDGFVARLNPALTVLNRSTYLGGSEYSDAISIAIDSTTGDVFVAGDTTSLDFPGTAGGARAATGGGFDGYVARLNAGLTGLIQATYVGGGGILVSAAAIHPMTGEVFVAGETNLTSLPGTTGAAQPHYGGGVLDAFVARFDPSLTVLNRTTYLGGSDRETAWALAVDPVTGEVIVAGDTRSTNFPATVGGAQPSYGGGDLYGGDAFVARFSRDLAAAPVSIPILTPVPPRSSMTVLAPSRRPQPGPIEPR